MPSHSLAAVEADEKQAQVTITGVGHERPALPTWKWILTLVGLYLGALLIGLDATIAADVQTPVYQHFGQVKDLAWVGIGYPMASVATIMAFCRLFERFELKTLTLASITLFEIGSALCGAAPTMNALIVGRVLAGVGGAGAYLGALNYIAIFAKPEMHSVLNAVMGAVWGTGTILGPVVGGALSQSSATWRWAFYLNLPLCGALLPVYLFVFPTHNPQPDLSVRAKLRTFDWIGAVLNAAVFVLFMTALAFSGALYAWSSATVIALWAVWGVCLVAFVGQQALALGTTTEQRIFPVHLLRNKDVVLLYVCTACSGAVNGLLVYFVPVFFAFTEGDHPLKAAVRLLPYICVFIFSIMLAGGSMPVLGRWSLYYLVGGLFIVAGTGGMLALRATTHASYMYAMEALAAVGAGLTFQNAYAVVSTKVAPRDISNGLGFINAGQIGTIGIALAIAGCLFQNLGFRFLKESLADYDLSDAAIHAALGGTAAQQLHALPPAAAAAAVDTIAYTISRVFAMGIAAGALLFVAAAFLTHEKVDFTALPGQGGEVDLNGGGGVVACAAQER